MLRVMIICCAVFTRFTCKDIDVDLNALAADFETIMTGEDLVMMTEVMGGRFGRVIALAADILDHCLICSQMTISNP